VPDLHDTLGVVELRRDFVRVAGPDAMKFLQGQLSQQVDVPVGTSAWTLLLQPQGKVVALLRVTRTGAEEYILDTDGGWAAAVVERLNRFKLRVKADIEVLDGWKCLAVRGPGAGEAVPEGGLPADWPGLPGVDVVGPAGEVEAPVGVPSVSLDDYEVARIEAGVPVMGRELDESTIPAEAGVVDRSVSFTKGCYTGQELVARIDSRGGNVPRRLRGVVVEGDEVPPAGATVHTVGDDGGKEVGVLTSVARSERLGSAVALAYVRRAVEPPAEVELRWDGGRAPAQVLTLPLVP
jgi:tRNA-modifying protein YgfZ